MREFLKIVIKEPLTWFWCLLILTLVVARITGAINDLPIRARVYWHCPPQINP